MINLSLWWKVFRAERAILRLVRKTYPTAKTTAFGAISINPRHLAIWIQTDCDRERDELRGNTDLIDSFRSVLSSVRYPPEAIPRVGFDFESQETVDRDYGGNWFFRFK